MPLRRNAIVFIAAGAIGTIVLAMQDEGRHPTSPLAATGIQASYGDVHQNRDIDDRYASPLFAYFRVSTDREGESGLGLETQWELIVSFAQANGFELIEELEEIQTGKGADAFEPRPQLAAAPVPSPLRRRRRPSIFCFRCQYL